MPRLTLPVEDYTTGEYRSFGATVRRRLILWATHLGDDVAVSAGTNVRSIGEGKVVLSEIKKGSQQKRNWGGLVIIEHVKSQSTTSKSHINLKAQHLNHETFYSLYGHLRDLRVHSGETVEQGDHLGEVAEGLTPENGWWHHAHLHFAIYTGPWTSNVLPGYWRPEQFWRTKKRWWHQPQEFIDAHNGSLEVIS